MRRNSLSAVLERDLRHSAVHECEKRLFDDDIEPAPLLAGNLNF
jgi:hypothetical protein